MSITGTVVQQPDAKMAVLDLTSSDDGDSVGTIANPLGTAAVDVQFEPIPGCNPAQRNAYRAARWRLSDHDDKSFSVARDPGPDAKLPQLPQARMFVRLAAPRAEGAGGSSPSGKVKAPKVAPKVAPKAKPARRVPVVK